MSYWKRRGKKEICLLCKQEWRREHLFMDCEEVEKWENQIYGEIGNNNQITNNKRVARIEAIFENKSKDHTFSWIYNWCIWKNYWDIVFQKFENCEDLSKQCQSFIKQIKVFEKLHLFFLFTWVEIWAKKKGWSGLGPLTFVRIFGS